MQFQWSARATARKASIYYAGRVQRGGIILDVFLTKSPVSVDVPFLSFFFPRAAKLDRFSCPLFRRTRFRVPLAVFVTVIRMKATRCLYLLSEYKKGLRLDRWYWPKVSEHFSARNHPMFYGIRISNIRSLFSTFLRRAKYTNANKWKQRRWNHVRAEFPFIQSQTSVGTRSNELLNTFIRTYIPPLINSSIYLCCA